MVVYDLKYIGPFLRMNTVNKTNVEKQLTHLSKEALKYLVLNSKCGITIPIKEIKLKNTPNSDINIINSFSPLLCIYKKANPKLVSVNNKFCLDISSMKKEVVIWGNAYMTLSILELVEYYKTFKDINHSKYTLSSLYLSTAKKQLDFYASYLRNEEGVFVDKKDVTDNIVQDVKFEEKSKKFKFSDQAILMAAYFKYSCLDDSKTGESYKIFSNDILNMFLEFKSSLYDLSFEELSKLCFALNIYVEYSNSHEGKLLLLDLSELLMENYKVNMSFNEGYKLDYLCLVYLNSLLLYKNTKMLKFKDTACEINHRLIKIYNPDLGIFIKEFDKKEVSFSNMEIMLYLISLILHDKLDENEDNMNAIIVDIFKRQVIDSGIILSWPEVPSIDDAERYNHFSMRSEDLIEEHNFKMPTITTPENAEMAPVFIKYVDYHRKKEEFKQNKLTFESSTNMFIFFVVIHFLVNK